MKTAKEKQARTMLAILFLTIVGILLLLLQGVDGADLPRRRLVYGL